MTVIQPAIAAETAAKSVKMKLSHGLENMFKPIQLAYNGYRNALRNPKLRWWVVGGTLLWLINPINAVPVLGEIDDAVVITIFAAEVSQIALEGIKNKQEQKAAIAPDTVATSKLINKTEPISTI